MNLRALCVSALLTGCSADAPPRGPDAPAHTSHARDAGFTADDPDAGSAARGPDASLHIDAGGTDGCAEQQRRELEATSVEAMLERLLDKLERAESVPYCSPH